MRLHGIDENNAGEVAELLAYFRALQRQLDLSVILVHHTRKNAAGGVAAGQAPARLQRPACLRRLEPLPAPHPGPLAVVQRAPRRAGFAAGVPGTGGDRRRDDPSGGRRRTPGRQRPRESPGAGAGAACPTATVLTRAKLRDALSVKNERLGEALESLEQAGRIRRTPAGWQRVD